MAGGGFWENTNCKGTGWGGDHEQNLGSALCLDVNGGLCMNEGKKLLT